jgi:hypothetical protein
MMAVVPIESLLALVHHVMPRSAVSNGDFYFPLLRFKSTYASIGWDYGREVLYLLIQSWSLGLEDVSNLARTIGSHIVLTGATSLKVSLCVRVSSWGVLVLVEICG